MKGMNVIKGQDLGVVQFAVDADTTTALYKKDPCMLEDDGKAATMTVAASKNYIGPALTIYDENKVELSYLPLSTAGYVDVATNSELLLSLEADGAVTETDRGNLSDLTTSATGSTNTGNSGQTISASTSTDCAQFMILDKINTPGNDWGDTNIQLLVKAAEHLFATKTAPAGV